MKKIVTLGLITLFSGCVTGYQKSGLTGGYKEKLISENQYELTYQGNATNSHAQIEEFWHKRAKELCKNGEYEYQYLNTENTVGYSQYGTFQYPRIIGTVKCKP